MPIVSQGNSVVLDVGAHDGLWIKSTGSAEVTVNQVYAGTPEVFNVGAETLRVGFYGEPVTVSIRAVSGNADYQNTPDKIYPLTSVQGGQRSDSSPLDIAQTVNQLAGAVAPLDGVVSVLDFGAKGDGVTDDTASINAALAASAGKTVVFPAAAASYRVTTLNIPANTTLLGIGRIDVYNPSALADFDGGPTIRAINATEGMLNPQGVGIALSGLSFVGGFSRTANIFTDASDPLRLTVNNCGFYFFKYGLGHNTKTVKVTKVFDCHFAQNGVGLRNLVDSHVTNCEINANDDGVAQFSGANDTVFTANKVEWNTKNNWVFSGSESCTVSGGVCDRSGDNGFDIRNSRVTINGIVARRNGSLGGKSHFYLETNPSVVITGIITETGGNDGGGGTVSPDYIVTGGGAGTGYNSFSNCALNGAVIGVESGLTTQLFYSQCLGASNRLRPEFSFSGTVAATTSQTIPVSGIGISQPIAANELISRKIRIGVATRNPSNGAFASQEFIVSIQRPFGSGASAAFIFRQNASSTAINDTGATVNVTIANIAADGSSFDVVLSNTLAGSMQIRAFVNKYEQP